MPSWKTVWDGSRETGEQISDLLTEQYDPPADAVSLEKDNPEVPDDETGWSVSAYFTERPDLAALEAFLDRNGIKIWGRTEELPDQDWVAHALEGLGVVRCGRFVLYGIHDADKLPGEDGDLPIRIDANQAFGTGHHPTTAGCLEVLDQMAGLTPENVLDLGTGSAILAIAGAKLWKTRILATDIDQTSVDIAAENVRLNDAAGISFITAAGFAHQTISEAAPFDFIFANILAGPLKELAPEMAAHSAPGATIILAGLLAEQEEDVTRTYQENGLSLRHRHHHATWPVLVFNRL